MPPRSRYAALHRDLLAWYDANGRELPWRQTRELYPVWVSEVMLQQTQVSTALPYYVRWMERFPTLAALSAASEQDVLAAWQGLGYYRRARYLLEGAKWIEASGEPRTAVEWRRVPGVGRYTAGAIAANCFGERAAAVDGNVERVFARLEGCDLAGAALHSEAWRWAEPRVHAERPGDWNQALMELGARICRPSAPLCDECPLRKRCKARRERRVGDLPRRSSPPVAIVREMRIVVKRFRNRYGVRRMQSGEWWSGMLAFPEVGPELDAIGTIAHQVTRHRVRLAVCLEDVRSEDKELSWHSAEELEALPMPSPHRKALRLVLEGQKASRSQGNGSASRCRPSLR